MNKPTPLYRFAALIPVRDKGSRAEPTCHPIVTLAESIPQAQAMAIDAGLLLIGQIASDGSVIPLPP